MKLWIKCSEIHIDIFPCGWILRNKFCAFANYRKRKNCTGNSVIFSADLFFDKLYDLYFKWIKEIFHKRLTTKVLMELGNALIFLTELAI